MPHQCVHCKRLIPIGSEELIKGCSDCGGRFFYYIRDEQFEKLKNVSEEAVPLIPKEESKTVEKDVREMAGIKDPDAPVILDLESVRAVGVGKYEIDVVNLFRKDRPIIFKVEEGKYIIDLGSLGLKVRED